MMMKLPYGIANFETIRTEDYFYVDKTRYLELLEGLSERYLPIRRFGFTEEEITPIFEALGEQVSREEIRTYYNGYRFSPNADQTVYNNDMILHCASERLLKGLSNR